MRWIPWTVLTCLFLGSSAALAETNRSAENPFAHDPFGENEVNQVPQEDRGALAGELAEQGRRAFEEHDLESAARLLDRAYRLGGDAQVLYFLALALHGIGHYDAAEERLRHYMSSVELDPGQRYALQLQLQGWRRQFSRVRVDTDPEGALLLLGGQPLGTTPMSMPLLLPNGEYQLEARLDGYETWRDALAVPGGDPVDLLIRLERIGEQRNWLPVALWTSAGLTGALVLVTTIVGAVSISADATLDEMRNPTPEDVERAGRLRGASYGLTVSWATLDAVTLTLAILRGLQGR